MAGMKTMEAFRASVRDIRFGDSQFTDYEHTCDYIDPTNGVRCGMRPVSLRGTEYRCVYDYER